VEIQLIKWKISFFDLNAQFSGQLHHNQACFVLFRIASGRSMHHPSDENLPLGTTGQSHEQGLRASSGFTSPQRGGKCVLERVSRIASATADSIRATFDPSFREEMMWLTGSAVEKDHFSNKKRSCDCPAGGPALRAASPSVWHVLAMGCALPGFARAGRIAEFI
jgi:hypothetical protein